MSEFVIESVLLRTEETLANRQQFGLSAETWEAFVTALDTQPRELPRLRRLFSEPSIFDVPKPR